MIRKLCYMAAFVALAALSQAQIDVVKTITVDKNTGQNKLFLMYEDSLFRILAPDSAISEVLKPFKETDRLPLAFRQLNSDNSTDYLQISKKRGLGTESQYLIHELLERGDCLVEQKKGKVRLRAIIAMSYTDGQVKGIKYYIGDHILYNYIDPKSN